MKKIQFLLNIKSRGITSPLPPAPRIAIIMGGLGLAIIMGGLGPIIMSWFPSWNGGV